MSNKTHGRLQINRADAVDLSVMRDVGLSVFEEASGMGRKESDVNTTDKLRRHHAKLQNEQPTHIGDAPPRKRVSTVLTHLAALILFAAGSGFARAQIVVPHGFGARLIAPRLDGEIPQLCAIDSPTFGSGVITAAAGNGVVTFRLITPGGTIRVLGTFVDPSPELQVVRARWDADSVLDGLVHATVLVGMYPSSGSTTAYLTLNPAGQVIEKWRRGGVGNQLGYDFIITRGGAGLPAGGVLLDREIGDGTALATMDVDFVPTIVDVDSLPPGRTDTDAQGLELDKTGSFGGGVLLADSDPNNDNITAIYELRDASQGGSYRLVGAQVPCDVRYYGDLAISSTGVFGTVVYVTDQITDEIQTVDTNGLHATWATGFSGVDSLCITPDGATMYVADQDGLYLVRGESHTNAPGPVVLCHSPSTPALSPMTRAPVSSARVVFNEPVLFATNHIAITNSHGQTVSFDASGSGSQFMLVALVQPLFDDSYTVTVSDGVTSVATGNALDGDYDGSAGGHYTFTLQHLAEWPPTQIIITNAASTPSGQVLGWAANRTGTTFMVESTADLRANTWAAGEPTSQWWTAETTWTDTGVIDHAKYYRVRGRR